MDDIIPRINTTRRRTSVFPRSNINWHVLRCTYLLGMVWCIILQIPWADDSKHNQASLWWGVHASEEEFSLASLHQAASPEELRNLRQELVDFQVSLARKASKKAELEQYREYLKKSLDVKKSSVEVQEAQVQLHSAAVDKKKTELEGLKSKTLKELETQVLLMRTTQKALEAQLNGMQMKKQQLLVEESSLREHLKQYGIEHYMDHASFSPTVRGAFKKSMEAVAPFFSLISVAVDTNERMVHSVASEIDEYMHMDIIRSPFLIGVLFYTILLVPVMTLMSLCFHVYYNIVSLTVSHYVLFTSTYLLSLCLVSSLHYWWYQQDTLVYLSTHHVRWFNTLVLGITLFYLFHLIAVGLQCVYVRGTEELSQFLAAAAVGIHFFLFAWRPVILDQVPVMVSSSYLWYASVFGATAWARSRKLHLEWVSKCKEAFRVIMGRGLLRANPSLNWKQRLGYIQGALVRAFALLSILSYRLIRWSIDMLLCGCLLRDSENTRSRRKNLAGQGQQDKNGDGIEPLLMSMENGGGASSSGEKGRKKTRKARSKSSFFGNFLETKVMRPVDKDRGKLKSKSSDKSKSRSKSSGKSEEKDRDREKGKRKDASSREEDSQIVAGAPARVRSSERTENMP